MFASHQMINDSGLRELERFLDKQDCTDKFGGLVQCVDYNNEILWLCEEHRFGYRVNESNGTQGSNGQQTHFDGRELGKLLSIDPQDPYIESSTDPLDPYYALDYVCVILDEIIENVVEPGKKHFRRDYLMKIAQKMRVNLNNLNRNWMIMNRKSNL
ncbi:uncharacterized protein OCT59_007741 [Rhizophagus irregularis]|uniref:uncharacterized protein n=1 Tax=Rhizophagus irregularis TaxID=588596 RepID=UPI00331974B6|nr:hypothetical protein OCT59_007741 [Rhizophagus irregularis]